MQSARNLHVYGKGLELAKAVYHTTAAFPGEDRFGLTSQMRRAAVSIGSNIAEGRGRRGDKELIGYLHFALGSASELESQCELAIELGFVRSTDAATLLNQIVAVKRILARLIISLSAKRPRVGGPTV